MNKNCQVLSTATNIQSNANKTSIPTQLSHTLLRLFLSIKRCFLSPRKYWSVEHEGNSIIILSIFSTSIRFLFLSSTSIQIAKPEEKYFCFFFRSQLLVPLSIVTTSGPCPFLNTRIGTVFDLFFYVFRRVPYVFGHVRWVSVSDTHTTLVRWGSNHVCAS